MTKAMARARSMADAAAARVGWPAGGFGKTAELATADPPRPKAPDRQASWRDFVTMAADFAFETDRQERLVFVAPDPALGWAAGALLGKPAAMLLAAPEGSGGLNPFRALAPLRRARAWLRRADGTAACLSFAAMPLLDEAGSMAGARGFGVDVSDEERTERAAAAALRRSELLDGMLWRVRQELLPARMVEAALAALGGACHAEGSAIVDLSLDRAGERAAPALRHHAGADPASVLETALDLMGDAPASPAAAKAADGRAVLVCPCPTRFGGLNGLVLWRAIGAPAWSAEEHRMVASATGIIRVVLEHESIQDEMLRQSRADPLTGLFNRGAFVDELARRIDRLERENLPGTLMIVAMDDFRHLNDRAGIEAGDAALCGTSSLLRATFRPGDLLGRLGGDQFGVWLDGADELAAAERADALCVQGRCQLAHFARGEPNGLSWSIGIGTRWADSGEEIDTLLYRVDRMVGELKAKGRGQWRVSRPEAE